MMGNKTEMDLYKSALNKNSLHLENPRMTAFLLSSCKQVFFNSSKIWHPRNIFLEFSARKYKAVYNLVF